MAVYEHFTAYGPVDPDVYEAASKAERDEFVMTGTPGTHSTTAA
jgi:hypothetical protein